MKRRDLVVGLTLVAALAVGVLLTRDSGLGDGEHFDLSKADGTFQLDDDLSISVTAGPRPLRVFSELHFAFRFRDLAGEPMEVEAPRIDFNMVMDMGPNGHRLVEEEPALWTASGVVLPQCGSGSRLWFGVLTFEAEGRPRDARLRLELDPPEPR